MAEPSNLESRDTVASAENRRRFVVKWARVVVAAAVVVAALVAVPRLRSTPVQTTVQPRPIAAQSIPQQTNLEQTNLEQSTAQQSTVQTTVQQSTVQTTPRQIQPRQTLVPVLVSNEGQTAGTSVATASDRTGMAQSFITGDNAKGYDLSSVEVGIAAATGVTVEVNLRSSRGAHSDSQGPGSIILATLKAPSSVDNDASTLESYSAIDVLLEANTRYWIEVVKTAGAAAGLSVATTTSEDSVDATSSVGWAVGENIWKRAAGSTTSFEDLSATSDVNMKIRLRGNELTSRVGEAISNRQTKTRAAVAKTTSSATKYATSFTTGTSRPNEWNLSGFTLSVSAPSGTVPRVSIHADNSGSPAANAITGVAFLKVGSAVVSTDVNAPDQVVFGSRLAGIFGFSNYDVPDDTTYWVVVDVGSGSGQVSLGTTKSNGYDPVPEPDWGMGNAMKVYNGTTWSDDSDGRSFRMSVNVKNSAIRGEVYIGLPQVGTATVARVFDDSGRVENVSWQWSRSTSSTGTFVDIPAAEGGTSNVYVPAASDLGMWLKAHAEYDDRIFGTDNARAVSLNPVLSRPVLSNAGQLGSFNSPFGFRFGRSDADLLAQAFTTGANSNGYLLKGVRLGVDHVYLPQFYQDLKWSLHADDGGEPAATTLFEPLTLPAADIDEEFKTFEELVHKGFWLAPDTKYWLVLFGSPLEGDHSHDLAVLNDDFTGDFDVEQQVPDLDQGSKSGWSLDFEALAYDTDLLGWHPWAEPLRIIGRSILRMSLLADDSFGPSEPLNVAASPGSSRVGLFWDAPERQGPSAVVRYEYRYKTDSGSFGAWTAVADSDSDGSSADERKVVVSGLTNGTEYTFELRAVNSTTMGEGLAVEVSATPNSNIATLGVAASAAKVTGKIDWVHYTLTRSGSTTDAATAAMRLLLPEGNDWAIPDTSLSHEVMFAAGEATATLSIKLDSSSAGVGFADAATTDGTLGVRVLSDGLDSIDASAPVEVVVVTDPAWVVSFENSSYTFDEASSVNAVTALVTASARNMAAPSSSDPADPAAGVISFTVASEDGTATSGSSNDFTAVSVEVTPDPRGFAVNSAGFVQGSIDVDLTVLDDTAVEPGEALSLYLDEAAGFAAATWLQYRGSDGQVGTGGTTRNVPVMITDNDVAVSSVSVTSQPALPLTSTSKDTYGRGETITFDVQFSSAVAVTGTPTFTFELGGSDTTASYSQGSGTTILTFSYLVQQTDTDTDGISWAANKLALAGGTILRVGTSSAATLTHTAQSVLSNHKSDGTMTAISAPQFPAATAARSVDENTSSGNVGTAVTAADADGDTVYYSHSATGTSVAEREHLAAFNRHFLFNPSNGQITIRAGTSLNYEARTGGYVVTISVTDREDAAGEPEQPPYTTDDTVTLTITLDNVDEDGTVTILGSPTAGATLSASVSDLDGSVAVQSWQWSSASSPTGTFTNITGATQSSYLVLATDENMYLRVTADYTDGHGAGKFEQSTTNSPVSVKAPDNLQAVPGNTEVALSWDNPNDADIVRYQYRHRSTADSNWNPDWTDIPTSNATTTTYTASGLVNGLIYTFQVRRMYLTNGLDDPGGPAELTSIPRSAVAAPANLNAHIGDKQVTLNWTNPADAAISGYQYRHRPTNASTWTPDWTTIPASNATTTSHLVTGLGNLTQYTFEVRAMHDNSPGPASTVTATPEGPPDPNLRTSYLYAIWTASTDTNAPDPDATQNRLDLMPCSGTRSFRVIWSLPKGQDSADDWQAQISARFGASDVQYAIHTPGPDIPELTGTVNLEGDSPQLSIRVRGRFGGTWGTWSPSVLLRCS